MLEASNAQSRAMVKLGMHVDNQGTRKDCTVVWRCYAQRRTAVIYQGEEPVERGSPARVGKPLSRRLLWLRPRSSVHKLYGASPRS